MTIRRNCWQVRMCGREPGGRKAPELGVCPAASERRLDGIHGGVNGGRACWAIAGTLGSGKPECDLARKLAKCVDCDFYRMVHREEGDKILFTNDIRARLR